MRRECVEAGPKQGVADGPDELVAAVRYQIKHGAQVVKICATAGVMSFEGPVGAQQMSAEELRAVVAEARRHGVKVAAHAHGVEGIVAASEAGVDSIEHGSLLDAESIAVMKRNGTWLVPTLYQWFETYELPPLLHEKNEYIKARIGKSMREAFKAGVKVALGTDAGAGPHGRSGKEFTAYVEHGMAPAEAIRTGTVNAAELLGLGDRLGRLHAGLLADVVAVPGNPLEDIRVLEDVRFVMRDGQVYKQPYRAGPRSTTALSLEYSVVGDPAAPPLLLVMGLGMPGAMWPESFVEYLLAEGLRVIRFDNRDAGASSKLSGGHRSQLPWAIARALLRLPVRAPYTLDDMAADGIGLLDSLGIRRCHVVGASLGGMISQVMAYRYPERVASLISVMSTTGNPDRRIAFGSPHALRAITQPPPASREFDVVVEHLMSVFRVIGSPGYPLDPVVMRPHFERVVSAGLDPDGSVRQLLAILASGDRRTLLRQVKAPTLVIHGAADPLVPPAAGLDTARSYSRCTLPADRRHGPRFPARLAAGDRARSGCTLPRGRVLNRRAAVAAVAMLCTAAGLAVFACERREPPHELRGRTMGTTWRVLVVAPTLDRAHSRIGGRCRARPGRPCVVDLSARQRAEPLQCAAHRRTGSRSRRRCSNSR